MFNFIFKNNCILFFSKMSLSTLKLQTLNTYEDAIRTLNGLISNANTITASIEKGTKLRSEHLPRTKMFCERADIQLNDINNLNLVHVAGTKGKGSTSTYIEAILRGQGYKTGLFTSPHLIEVRERIKINGLSISKLDFSHHFWNVYDRLYHSKTYEEDMPFYFQFLTILAFHIFLEEKVDYVVLETGIGGRFDSTNIVSNTKIACITSLGFDHTEILGTTMNEIAWNKAGIIKPGSIVVTCDSQPQEGLKAISAEVELHQNKLFLIPVKDHTYLQIGKCGKCIHIENALLASAVCHILLNNDLSSFTNHININSLSSENTVKVSPEFCTQEEYLQIINATEVAGRYQTIINDNVEYFIDGAHTMESMKTCVEWFKEVSITRSYKYRFLVFMITGRRSVEDLLSQLTQLKFDGILLTPLVPFRHSEQLDFAPDNSIIAKEKAKLAEIAATWTRLNLLLSASQKSPEYFDSFEDINEWLLKFNVNVQVLIVGSLHLVGCALSVLKNKESI